MEFASIGIICSADDTISIVFNFIALAIIAEFDNFVFDSLKNESFKMLTEREFCKRVLIIQHTTSKKAREHELSFVKDETGEYRPLRILFSNRTNLNKFLYVLYKVFRLFFVSVFYYFLPFAAILISTLFPLLARYYW